MATPLALKPVHGAVEGGRLLLGLRSRKLSRGPPRSACAPSPPPPPSSASPAPLLRLALTRAPPSPSALASHPARARRAGGQEGPGTQRAADGPPPQEARPPLAPGPPTCARPCPGGYPPCWGVPPPPHLPSPGGLRVHQGWRRGTRARKWRASRDRRAGASSQGGHQGLALGVPLACSMSAAAAPAWDPGVAAFWKEVLSLAHLINEDRAAAERKACGGGKNKRRGALSFTCHR